jgi:hypothetical protein
VSARIRSSIPVAGIATLTLGVLAALMLALADVLWHVTDAESASTLLWIGGWMLVVWALIVVAVLLVRMVRIRPRVVEAVLVLLALAVVVGTAWVYPPFGSGAGIG